ncbi:unnamed protein product [Ixodes pacificus]
MLGKIYCASILPHSNKYIAYHSQSQKIPKTHTSQKKTVCTLINAMKTFTPKQNFKSAR